MERVAAGEYRVSGPLVFATVPGLLEQSKATFDGEAQLQVDLSAVQTADSAGLALLIEWYRLAARANRGLRFVNVPEQLRALARISDVDELLLLR
jgi:phospholipid transport system transporter-binding protein